MRSLSDEEEGGHVGWDDQVPAHVEADFREVLGHMKESEKGELSPIYVAGAQPRPGKREAHVTHLR